MANWTFNPNHYEERSFSIIPEGNHRVRISDVAERTFASGNEGYEIVLDVAGHAGKLWHYLVLDRTDEKKTNQRLAHDLWKKVKVVQSSPTLCHPWGNYPI